MDDSRTAAYQCERELMKAGTLELFVELTSSLTGHRVLSLAVFPAFISMRREFLVQLVRFRNFLKQLSCLLPTS